MTRIAVLRKFFYRDEKDNLKGFAAELRALSDDEKDELAQLAAIELNVEVKG